MATRRALLSVSNKDGVVALARALAERGVELVSSGGTARALADAGVPVRAVAEYTGAPEMLGGRVKTLHPRIFGGILARDCESDRRDLELAGIAAIDLVVVNLYPFEQTIAAPDVSIADAIEQIDVGGPSMVRAAAKNFARVVVVVDPADYPLVLRALDEGQGTVPEPLRQQLALKAFAHTAAYDAAIADFLRKRWGQSAFPETLTLGLRRVLELRYGENPHQHAAYYDAAGDAGAAGWQQLGGKALSYNNLLDLDAAWALVSDLPEVAACVVKHTNPCGAACGDAAIAEVFQRAWDCDPLSGFGGIVAVNQPVDRGLAERLGDLFLELVVAPSFQPDALELLRKKRNLRLIAMARAGAGPARVLRTAAGGVLIQSADAALEDIAEGRVVTAARPTAEQLRDLDFAWRVAKHVKSNAVTFARECRLVAAGAGQMSRVDAVALGCRKGGAAIAGCVAASDAFFPFRDGIDELARAGVRAVVQPGGSMRDEEVIAAANEHGLAMVFTAVRHFRH